MTTTDFAPKYATPQEAGVKVGDYFYGSWGYDQTNVNYFRVVGLTAKCVKIQEVTSTTVDDNGPITHVAPTPNVKVGSWVRKPEGWSEFDPTAPAPIQTKRIQVWPNGDGLRVRLAWKSYADLYKWDGTPKYQTGAGWGH